MRKKSDFQKKLEGTYRKDRSNSVINSVSGVPEKPIFTDEIANKTWDSLVSELSSIGFLSRLDAQILETTCLLFSRIKAVAESLRIQGEAVMNSKGNLVLNPLAKCLKDYCATFDTLCNSLALTPQSRSKMGLSIKNGTCEKGVDFFQEGVLLRQKGGMANGD